MLGKLEKEEIEEVLTRQVIGRIGCHADGITYIVPISYAYDGVFVYGHTREGMKINMMRKNAKVCFEVDELKDMANWKSVIAWGVFEELINEDDRKQGLKKLTQRILPIISSETTHLFPHWPFPSEDLSCIKGIVFRIRLHEKSGRFETNTGSDFFAT